MPHRIKPLKIDPPLLNSANPWCTTLEQLQELYTSPYTGAVTTRTSLLDGFPNDSSIHQFAFYNPTTHDATSANPNSSNPSETGSLNTLGYSPKPLSEYLSIIKTISDSLPERSSYKPIIISVTGTPDEVIECYRQICTLQPQVKMRLAMEINLSCPNIPSKPPPAYSSEALLSYLNPLKSEVHTQLSEQLSEKGKGEKREVVHVPIGIKTPPYTYHDQFKGMIDALVASAEAEPSEWPCPVSFITATNTLGSSLLLTPGSRLDKSVEKFQHTLSSATGPGIGIGGLAGAPLHPLALGNVYTIKKMLSQHKELKHIDIIGIGGVEDVDGYQRMRAVGAAAVGVGTALGRKGVGVFQEIGKEVKRMSEGMGGGKGSKL